MNWGFAIAIGIVLVSALVVAVSIVRPSGLADRAVAFDTLASTITCGLLLWAVATGDGVLLEVSLVFGLLGFLGSVSAARFIERRGR